MLGCFSSTKGVACHRRLYINITVYSQSNASLNNKVFNCILKVSSLCFATHCCGQGVLVCNVMDEDVMDEDVMDDDKNLYKWYLYFSFLKVSSLIFINNIHVRFHIKAKQLCRAGLIE